MEKHWNISKAKGFPHCTTRRGWYLWAIWCAILAGVAYGQADRTYPSPQPDKYAYGADPGNVPDAIAKVKSGDFFGVHVEMIAHAHATEAVSALEEQFPRAQSPLDKEHIASALVRLGDKNETYWDFLIKSATAAVESNVPDSFLYDAQGKASSENSAELAAWASAHNLSLADAGREVLFKTGAVAYLAVTGDQRAIPLLRQALAARNFTIVDQAARGLAEINDKDSIPLIVAACQRAPAEAAEAIALSLVYFDDTQAQNAVNLYVRSDLARISREARAKGATPFR